MLKPGTPQNEQARLATLRSLELLDTAAEECFDRVTRLAKHLFNVPIALVTLVDEDRQWFKSCIGLNVSETPRDISFCGHAILGSSEFVIHDTHLDPRFADNPLVLEEPHIRFYAGNPIRALNGQKMGTLCIIDRQPRTLSKADIAALQDLTSMVEHELAAIQMATQDELTQLANRRGFMLLAQNNLNLCLRHQTPASLVFIDLDKFKEINDSCGHQEGDKVLTTFARHMLNSYRCSDICARIGGDEFVVLLSDTDKQLAEATVEKFSQAIADHNRRADCGYSIGFSHSIIEYDPDRHRGIADLLSEGDALMYRAKHAKAS